MAAAVTGGGGRAARAPMVLVLAVALAHAAACPFTKVEESFNAQAVHDIGFELLARDDGSLERFDHFEFPGVVPRTFWGAWALALLAAPVQWLLALFGPLVLGAGAPALEEGLLALYAMRFTLAIVNWVTLVILGESVGAKFGRDAQRWFGLACLGQFHLMFYLGRPLPNTFALGLCALALARWLDGSWEEAVGFLVFCTVVFRCDTLILAGLVGLSVLFSREANFFALFIDGLASGSVSLFLTCALDSFMWNRPLWPEGTVLFFNTVLNKSSEWGVMPWHWYATSALPRALLVCFPLALLGLLQPLSRLGAAPPLGPRANALERAVNPLFALVDPTALKYLAFPAFGYIAVYSILPHKEVRFLFQAFPFLTVLAALALSKLERSARAPAKGKAKAASACIAARKWLARLGLLAAVLGLFASYAIVQAYLMVSMHNYPGADALLFLKRHHTATRSGQPARAHYCVYAAMSGITRFLEHSAPELQLSKREDEGFVATLCQPSSGFDYLIVDVSRFESDTTCRANFDILATFEGEPKLDWRNRAIRTTPTLHVLQRK